MMFRTLVLLVLLVPQLGQSQVPPIPQNKAELDQLVFNLQTNTIPQLRVLHQCSLDASSILNQYAGIKNIWIGKSKPENQRLLVDLNTFDSNLTDINTNLHANFSGLQKYQNEFFSELNIFVDTNQKYPADSLEGLRDQINRIDQGLFKLSDRLYNLAKKDSLFLDLLSHMKNAAEIEYQRQEAVIKNLLLGQCSLAGLEATVSLVRTDIQTVLSDIERLQGFTLESIQKRNALIKEVYRSTRQEYVDRYNSMAAAQLGEIGDSVVGALELSAIGEEILVWWTSINTNGLAESLHLKYLQYEAPRSILLADQQKLKIFESRILARKSAPSKMQDFYMMKIKTFQKTIQDNIDTIESRGWKGQMQRQVLLNKKRRTISDKISPECIQAIDLHLSSAEETNDLEKYRRIEKIYRNSVEACERRG